MINIVSEINKRKGLFEKLESFEREIQVDGGTFRPSIVYKLHLNDGTYDKISFKLSAEFIQEFKNSDEFKEGLESIEKQLNRELRLRKILEK